MPDLALSHTMFAILVKYNLTELLKPWQWPAMILLLLPLGTAIATLFRPIPRDDRQWVVTYLLGFISFFPFAMIIEPRAYEDLTGFAVMSVMVFARQTQALSPEPRRPR